MMDDDNNLWLGRSANPQKWPDPPPDYEYQFRQLSALIRNDRHGGCFDSKTVADYRKALIEFIEGNT